MANRKLICGQRDFNNTKAIYDIMKTFPKGTTIIEGEAKGADTISRICAEILELEYEPYPAFWSDYGKAAGPLRNQEMLELGKPDEVHAFYINGQQHKSRGTKDMVNKARAAGIRVFEHFCSEGVYKQYYDRIRKIRIRSIT